jgi:hypothetical protein
VRPAAPRGIAPSLALIAFLLFVSAARVTAHDPAILDPRRATPGIRLELVEMPQIPAVPLPSRRYRLVATGVPPGVTFGVWTRDFAHGFHEVVSGFRADGTGKLVSIQDSNGRARDLNEMVFDPGPYFRGAIWEVALVSEDRAITAFTRAIPRPIVEQDGWCVVTLELVSHRGQRFLATGRGFVPGEEVVVESRYAGRVHQRRQQIPPDGALPPDLISHAGPGSEHAARYSVKGRSCHVTIEYEWGEHAFRRG